MHDLAKNILGKSAYFCKKHFREIGILWRTHLIFSFLYAIILL